MAAGTQALSEGIRFPFAVALVLVGIVLGQAARGGPERMAALLEGALASRTAEAGGPGD